MRSLPDRPIFGARVLLRLRYFLSLLTCGTLLAVAPAGCAWTRRGPCPQALMQCREMTQRGLDAADHGDWQASEKLLAEATQTYPEDSEARGHYAAALWQRGARPEALAEIDRALKQSPDDARLLVQSAQYRLQTADAAAAASAIERALDVDPASARAWTLRAQVRSKRGDLRGALADYHRALSLDPHQQSVLLELSTVYLQLEQPQRALAHLQDARDLSPTGEEPVPVLVLWGRASTALGRYDDAIQAYASALRRSGPSPELLCQLAEAQLLAGRLPLAQQALAESLALAPHHTPSLALQQRLQTAALPIATGLRR